MFFVLAIKSASAVRPVGVRRRVVAVEVNRRTEPPVGEIAARAHRDSALYPCNFFNWGLAPPNPRLRGTKKASAARPVGARRREVAEEVHRRTEPPAGEIAARAHRSETAVRCVVICRCIIGR